MGTYTSSIGAITNPEDARICSQAGLNIIKDKLSNLQDLRNTLLACLREVEAAKEERVLASRMLLGVKIGKASIDAFLAISAELADGVLGTKSGKVVTGVYKTMDPLAKASGQMIAGQRVDVAKTMTGVASGALSTVQARAGHTKDAWKNMEKRGGTSPTSQAEIERLSKIEHAARFGKTQVFKSDIVVDAVQSGGKSVKPASYIKYASEIGSMAADHVKGGMPAKVANNFKIVNAIGKELLLYNMELGKAFDEAIENEDLSDLEAIKRNFRKQLTNVERTLLRLQSALEACEPMRLT